MTGHGQPLLPSAFCVVTAYDPMEPRERRHIKGSLCIQQGVAGDVTRFLLMMEKCAFYHQDTSLNTTSVFLICLQMVPFK